MALTKDDVREVVIQETAEMRKDLRHQGVLLEDLGHRFKAVTEAISNNLKVKSQVGRHEKRITDLETNSALVVSTVALYSRQLKPLTQD